MTETSSPDQFNSGDEDNNSILGNFLKEHPDLSAFIQIDNPDTSIDKVQNILNHRDSMYKQNLKKLTNLESSKNSNFLSSSDLSPISKPPFLWPDIFLEYHQMQFLFFKFKKLKDKINRNFQTHVSPLIQLFNQLTNSDTENIPEIATINFNLLNDFLQKPSNHLKLIKTQYNFKCFEFAKIIKKRTKTTTELKKELIDILAQAKCACDPSLNFFCPTQLQDEFESILFSPNFSMLEKLNKIIEQNNFSQLTPQNLVTKIVKLNNFLIQFHKLKKEDHVALLIPFLFRMIFDELYPYIKLYSLPELNFDLILKLQSLKISDLNPPLDYLPFLFHSDEIQHSPPRSPFRNDSNYSLAIEQVEFISFYTNPLDILHHISAAICEIEKSATIYRQQTIFRKARKRINSLTKNKIKQFEIEMQTRSFDTNDKNLHEEEESVDDNSDFVNFLPANVEVPEMVFPFDVVFSLFVCTLLSADLPEFMRIALFADQYTPTHGLCASFEFALAKFNTASVHLQNLAQKMIENEKQHQPKS